MASSLGGILSRTIQTVKPHVPLIKFRKGGHNITEAGHSSSGPTVAQAAAVSAPSKGEPKVTVRPTIEDYQLPKRYQRLALDEAEINAINTVKPHVPLIKFRKGGHNITEAGHSSSGPTVAQAAAVSAPSKGEPKVTVRPTIEDYQLPKRYQRLALDEAEINAINSGGAY